MMRKILYAVLICFFANTANAQTKVNDTQAMTMLKEFYMVYNDAWAIKGSKALVSKKLYALHDKYLTKKFRAQLRKIDILDDPLRGDDFIDAAHLKNLRVTKDAKRTNTYFVNYTVPVKTIDNMPFTMDVEKHIVVATEAGKPKIAEVLFGLKK